MGGLSLPNFLHYYQAVKVHKVAFWMSHFREGAGPVWSSMERYSCEPLDPASLLCAPLPLSRKYPNNQVVSSSLKLWSQFRTHFRFKQMIPFTPIVRNPAFKPALHPKETLFYISTNKRLHPETCSLLPGCPIWGMDERLFQPQPQSEGLRL